MTTEIVSRLLETLFHFYFLSSCCKSHCAHCSVISNTKGHSSLHSPGSLWQREDRIGGVSRRNSEAASFLVSWRHGIKELKTARWKDCPCSRTGKVRNVKMAVLPNWATDLTQPPPNHQSCFHGVRKDNSKIHIETQKVQNSQSNAKQKGQTVLKL